MAPSKDVQIVLQEEGELLVDQRPGLCAKAKETLVIYKDVFQGFLWFYHHLLLFNIQSL